MNAVRWLGLDTALTAFGWAVMEQWPEGDPRLLELGTWRTKPDKGAPGKFADHARRIDAIGEQLVDLVERVRPSVLFVESLAFVPRSGFLSSSSMGRVRGLVDGVGKALRLPVHEFGPMVMKRALCGSASAEKEQVAKALWRRYPSVATAGTLDENATDAAAVAHVGASHESVRWFLGQQPLSVPTKAEVRAAAQERGHAEARAAMSELLSGAP